MSLEQILGQRYRVTTRLPAQTSTHQRYSLESADGSGQRFVLSFRDYSSPISATTVAQQDALIQTLSRPPSPLLCRAVEWRMGNDFQYVISEPPGELTVRELLQNRQALKVEEAEAFLRMMADACEAAVQHGWPRIMLDSAHLYLDTQRGIPRIPLPDMPNFDAAGPNMLAFDPMQTMQFNAAELSTSFDLPPKDTRDYIRPLAALCCDLLGQPQAVRGGNARYQPVPQLSSSQNVLLRRALTSEGRSGFAGARAFIEEFFGGPAPPVPSESYTENLRTLTVTLSETESNAMEPVPAASVTVAPKPVTTIPAQPPPLPSQNPLATAPLRVLDEEVAQMDKLPRATRLRLVPEKEGSPVLALSAEGHLIFGRSALDADFVAQFRPRTSLNDARSRRVSRAQGIARIEDGHILYEEKETMNPTVHSDGSLHTGAALDSPTHLILAGEYPLEMHRVSSDYDGPREIVNHPEWSDAIAPQGSLVARPAGPGVLLWEAALVFSDVGIHFSTSGRPWFRVERDRLPPLRAHHLAGHFWIEVLDEKVFHVPERSTLLRRHDLILLRNGLKIQLGNHAYSIQSVALGEAVAS
jgi:hypothetical protein